VTTLYKTNHLNDDPPRVSSKWWKTNVGVSEYCKVSNPYFVDWLENFEDVTGYKKNTDYVAITQKRVTAQGNETTYDDHILKIDMAKEIAMIQRNAKGKHYYKLQGEELKEFKRVLENSDNTLENSNNIARSKISTSWNLTWIVYIYGLKEGF